MSRRVLFKVSEETSIEEKLLFRSFAEVRLAKTRDRRWFVVCAEVVVKVSSGQTVGEISAPSSVMIKTYESFRNLNSSFSSSTNIENLHQPVLDGLIFIINYSCAQASSRIQQACPNVNACSTKRVVSTHQSYFHWECGSSIAKFRNHFL